jgi:chitin synthase
MVEEGGKWKMKTMQQLMDPSVAEADLPKNCLHLFQACTWDFGLEEKALEGRRINFIFAIKQRNDGKINSHKWFFQAIAKFLKPEQCLMLDIGTKPDNYAVAKLFKYMQHSPECGGCCGEIEVDLSEYKSMSKYLLRAAQFYEYKLSHTPDKAMESFFGYNSVLPGAYCMFRWKAISGAPMDAFFKLVNSTKEPTCPEANEYLAEDRVMCLQIYIKENAGYYLCYLPDAKAVTDAPELLMVLFKQRRRWMNGALFAAWMVVFNCGRMINCSSTSKHPVYR